MTTDTRKQQAMTKDTPCPQCGELLDSRWLVRHLKSCSSRRLGKRPERTKGRSRHKRANNGAATHQQVQQPQRNVGRGVHWEDKETEVDGGYPSETSDDNSVRNTTCCPGCGRRDFVKIAQHLAYHPTCRSAYMQRELGEPQVIKQRRAQADDDLLRLQVNLGPAPDVEDEMLPPPDAYDDDGMPPPPPSPGQCTLGDGETVSVRTSARIAERRNKRRRTEPHVAEPYDADNESDREL